MAEFDDFSAEHTRTAAQIEADVGVEHIADVYAKALLGATENAGQTDPVLRQFDWLVREVLDSYPKLEAILNSRLISHDEKVGIFDRVFGAPAGPMLVNFLKVVSRHDRLDCLRAIHRQAHVLYDELRGRVDVQVTTAMPLGKVLLSRIAEGLRASLGAEPLVRQVVDPELIGGLVVRVGDTIYDGSIASQLQTIRQQMIDRSVHEIQSRRDRFRDPAGN